jgi:hypothetical protein
MRRSGGNAGARTDSGDDNTMGCPERAGGGGTNSRDDEEKACDDTRLVIPGYRLLSRLDGGGSESAEGERRLPLKLLAQDETCQHPDRVDNASYT